MIYQIIKNGMNPFNYKEILHSLCIFEKNQDYAVLVLPCVSWM